MRHRRDRRSGGSIPACAGEPLHPTRAPSRRWVYPRVCGGTIGSEGEGGGYAGLSPRVRGNPSNWYRETRACGSIPACAGEPAV